MHAGPTKSAHATQRGCVRLTKAFAVRCARFAASSKEAEKLMKGNTNWVWMLEARTLTSTLFRSVTNPPSRSKWATTLLSFSVAHVPHQQHVAESVIPIRQHPAQAQMQAPVGAVCAQQVHGTDDIMASSDDHGEETGPASVHAERSQKNLASNHVRRVLTCWQSPVRCSAVGLLFLLW